METSTKNKKAYFAGGCFWCVESDLQKIPNVISVDSGYAGEPGGSPSYENHEGFREAVEVTYDPTKTTYGELVRHFFRSHDPTDVGGSFHDRGFSYTSAIYYTDEEEENIALQIKTEIDESGRFDNSVATVIEPFESFYKAEEYHQNYKENNPAHYEAYRKASGRSDFIVEHWGTNKK